MKTKIRETKKDINIDIQIENNLLSKNKYNDSNVPPPQQAAKKKGPYVNHPFYNQYNPQLGSAVNDFLGIMAAKSLYSLSDRSQPFSIQNILPPVQPTQEELVAATKSVPSTPIQNRTPNKNMPPSAGRGMSLGFPQTGLTRMPDVSNFRETSRRFSGIPSGRGSILSAIDQEDDDGFESAEDPPFIEDDEDGEAVNPFDQNDLQNVSMSLHESMGEIQTEFGIEVLTDEQENVFNTQLLRLAEKKQSTAYKNRNVIIAKIMDLQSHKDYRPRLKTIIDQKLGNYVKQYRPEYWEELMLKRQQNVTVRKRRA